MFDTNSQNNQGFGAPVPAPAPSTVDPFIGATTPPSSGTDPANQSANPSSSDFSANTTPPAFGSPVSPSSPSSNSSDSNGSSTASDQTAPTFGSPPAFGGFGDSKPQANDSTSDGTTNTPSADSSNSSSSLTAPSMPSTPQDDELTEMKQKALSHLQPLVEHLDQSPEEQFKTTMMMIQATDDHQLLKKAFDTAQKITDDKARAQALLDVINEINYFTTQNHHPHNQE